MGDSSKQTSTTSNTPIKEAQPLIKQAMGDGLSAYKSGGGLVKPMTQSTVVPYAQATTQGMNALTGMGTANSGGQGISGQYQNIINSGGYNADQMDAVGGIRDTANSSFDPFGNPAFKQVLQQAQEGSMYGSNANAAGMGRYGSGTHQGVQQRELGDLTARMVGGEYNNWLGRRDGAQTQLFNAGQQGQANMGNAYEGMQAPINSLFQRGSMDEDLMGRFMNDSIRINQEKQNAPLANIQALLGIASGAGQYGTQKQTAQGPNNTFSNVAGGLLGGGSLLSGLF